MAITTTADLQVTSATDLLLPKMAARPLQTALENLNYLWAHHSPPLVDVCPTWHAVRGIYVYPVVPSQDGIEYTFETRLFALDGGGAAITVDYCTTYTGGSTTWHNLLTVTPGTTANALLTDVRTGVVIPRTAVALRWSLDGIGGGNLGNYPQHFLVYPSPGDAVAGIQVSGFVPFDDGLLGLVGGAPVTTEHVNRCKASALALLTDRRQQALSLLQNETGTTTARLVDSATTRKFVELPVVRVFFPCQAPTVLLDVYCLADVQTGGTTASMVRVRQVGIASGEQVLLAADGAIHSAALTLQLQGDGLARYADIAVGTKTTSGYATDVRAVSGYWMPGS